MLISSFLFLLNWHDPPCMKNGIYNLEYTDFRNRKQGKKYTFLFIFTPLRLEEATSY